MVIRQYDVIVIGGGPAGLMAAGQAAQAGASTLLLEKMVQPGRKLRITGKGRCNLTNVASLDEFIAHFGETGQFLRQAFYRFFTPDLIAFLEGLGIRTVTERGGRVFPVSNEADEIADGLVRWVDELGVTVRTRSPVERLATEGNRVVGAAVAGAQAASSTRAGSTGSSTAGERPSSPPVALPIQTPARPEMDTDWPNLWDIRSSRRDPPWCLSRPPGTWHPVYRD